MDIVSFALRFLWGMGIAGCTIYNFYVFFRRPAEFSRMNYDGYESLPPVKRAGSYLYVFAAFGGVVYCLYELGMFALGWMPHSWRVDGGSGELGSNGIAKSIALIFAFYGALFLNSGMCSFARRLTKAESGSDEL